MTGLRRVRHATQTRRRSVDAGTVTAELAMALPAVVLLCAALLTTGQAALGAVRCADAARAGARLAARGESAAAVVAEAGRRAPPGASVALSRAGDQVRVVVRAPLGGLTPSWAGLAMSGTATASVEGGP